MITLLSQFSPLQSKALLTFEFIPLVVKVLSILENHFLSFSKNIKITISNSQESKNGNKGGEGEEEAAWIVTTTSLHKAFIFK